MLATHRCDGRRFGRASAARRNAGRTLAAVLPLLPLAAAAGEPANAPPPAGLTIAILDLTDLPGYAARREPEERRPTWRTTFGSERETRPEITSPTAVPLPQLAETDVVLLQGVDVTAPLRRFFPPRSWRIVMSRRIISIADSTGSYTARTSLPPTTAIAIRARKIFASPHATSRYTSRRSNTPIKRRRRSGASLPSALSTAAARSG